MSGLIAAIDQGTTSTRCLLFNREGSPAAVAQEPHAQITPRPGWLEHDPLEIWRNTQKVVAAALAQVPGADILAVGITNQRETTVVWSKTTGLPLANAIVWQDARTADICAALAANGGPDRFRPLTGLPLATYFSGPKVRWLIENVPAVAQAVKTGDALVGTIDSWLVWNLTGGADHGAHVTDPTNASRTLLMDLGALAWSPAMCEALGVPPETLPAIRPTSTPGGYGLTRRGGPFGAEIPITAAIGDQQGALAGQACFGVGQAKNTYGTGCFTLMNVGPKPPVSTHGLLSTVAWQLSAPGQTNEKPSRAVQEQGAWSAETETYPAGRRGCEHHATQLLNRAAGSPDIQTTYALEGSVAVAGSLIQWLRDQLGLIKTSAEVEELAREVTDTGGVHLVPAFSGLFAPHWDATARGALVGLTRYADKRHIARAALEAVAYQTKDVIEAMEADSGIALAALKVDGGMVANGLLMQIQADMLGVPVVAPRHAEATALGAAYMAGLAVGYWTGFAQLSALYAKGGEWQPSGVSYEEGYKRWQKAVEKAKGWES